MTDLACSNAHSYPIIQGIQLISTHELPDRLRSVFKHPLFNAVQSKCFEPVFKTDDNFVLSAPTSSGKTAILELAICRLLAHRDLSGNFKIVYQAPTKALCAERQKDWQTRFNYLGLKCAELTGDTEPDRLRNVVQHAHVIITTPEKWDSLTRKWKDHDRLVKLVRLFLIDEVHILKEDRGATLEAIVSRMKSIQSDVRFVALSATIPNSEDIATWLGKNGKMQHVPARREIFGERFRPVKLTKYVIGLQANGANDFAMEAKCTRQLPDIIMTYSKERKPILVFCFTRPSTENTAKALADWWKSSKDDHRCWTSASGNIRVDNVLLAECIKSGVAFHHAGMDTRDRTAIEKGYIEGSLNVICCTSTLAVGVNLPCHMVIIKNTVSYHAEGCKEYSDLEVMQMLGRAGRPQFDRTGIAVIMTRQEKVVRYEKMVSGQEILESRLHENLIDHMNAEIGLGTIFDDESAKRWLQGTFFFVRFSRNPERYQFGGVKQSQSTDIMMQHVCGKHLKLLRDCDLITTEDETFRSTEFGDSMARYYIPFDTMKTILSLQAKPRISELLSVIAQASEYKSIRFRSGEKQLFKQINSSPSIKFPILVDLASPAHKVSLIIQAILGGIDCKRDDRFGAHDAQFVSESFLIFQHVHRLIRCIIDCQIHLEDSVGARNALELARSLGAKAWDDSPLQLLQVEQIGQVAVRKLVNQGIKTIEDLENTEAHRIEMYLSKNPPFGSMMLLKLKSFPKLRDELKMMGKPTLRTTIHGKCLRLNIKAELGFINDTPPEAFGRKCVHIILLAETSDGHKVHFSRISGKRLGNGQDILFPVDLTSPNQTINCYVSCDDIIGTLKEARLDPKLPRTMFPVNQPPGDMIANISNPSRNIPRPHRTTSAGSREFDDADIQDSDLVAVEDNYFSDIDELDLTTATVLKANEPLASNGKHRELIRAEKERLFADTHGQPPNQLSNGKWLCRHFCKNKKACGHACCKDGLDKPPKPSKTLAKETIEESTVDMENKRRKTTMNHYTQSETRPKGAKSITQLLNENSTNKFPYPDRQTKHVSTPIDSCENYDASEAHKESVEMSSSNVRSACWPQKAAKIFLTNTSSPEKLSSSSTVRVHEISATSETSATAHDSQDDDLVSNNTFNPRKRKAGDDHFPQASSRYYSRDNYGVMSGNAKVCNSSYAGVDHLQTGETGVIDDYLNNYSIYDDSNYEIHENNGRVGEEAKQLEQTNDLHINQQIGVGDNDFVVGVAAAHLKAVHTRADPLGALHNVPASSQIPQENVRNDILPTRKDVEDQKLNAWILREFGDFIELV